jgi:hypothetical protein
MNVATPAAASARARVAGGTGLVGRDSAAMEPHGDLASRRDVTDAPPGAAAGPPLTDGSTSADRQVDFGGSR